MALISEVIPTIMTLKMYLSKEEDEGFLGIGTMKQFLTEEINRRFDLLFENKYYIIATMLDPRFKLAFFKTNIDINYAKNILINDNSEFKSDDSNEDKENASQPKVRKLSEYWDGSSKNKYRNQLW